MVKEKKLIIVSHQAKLYRFADNTCTDAANVYRFLAKSIGCTYLIYMYENLLTNEKFVYSSNWLWQDVLIGEKLINDRPIFLTAFNYLENRNSGHIFIPWYLSPPSTKKEKNVCGIRSEFNIANGFGYGAKGNGIRESLAFGGDAKDSSFYKNFISYPNIFYETLRNLRISILYKQHSKNIQNLPNLFQ